MPDAAAPQPDLAHFQRVLAEMVDLAAAVARTLASRIEDATPAEAAPLAAAFERVTRIVRRAILLAVHLAKSAETAAATRIAGRLRIIREVSDAIDREKIAPEKAETLRVELVERLDAPDLAPQLDHDIATRPVADIILEFKRDMGLIRLPGAPPWPRRTPDDIADFLTRAQKPTQPGPPTSWPAPPS